MTDVSFSVSKSTKRFMSASAVNVIAENGVKLPDGSYLRDDSGNFVRNPALVDPAVKQIADKYRTAVAPIADRVVGQISADIVRDAVRAGRARWATSSPTPSSPGPRVPARRSRS